MGGNLLDIRRTIRIYVSIHDSLVSNLGIDKCINEYDYPENSPYFTILSVPFYLSCVLQNSLPLHHPFTAILLLMFSADTAQMIAGKGSYAYNIALSTAKLSASF